MEINFTDYLKYRAALRGFDIEKIERIVRYSPERYFDTITRSSVVIGKYDDQLVMIPYEKEGDHITPITIHTITQQQIRFRLKTERFTYE